MGEIENEHLETVGGVPNNFNQFSNCSVTFYCLISSNDWVNSQLLSLTSILTINFGLCPFAASN